MTIDTELSDKIIAAVEAIPRLRPAIPIATEHAGWWPFDPRKYAVGLTATVVEIRVVATSLPLGPLMEDLSTTIRPLLSGTRWEAAELRVMVTELDAAAFSPTESDADHKNEA